MKVAAAMETFPEQDCDLNLFISISSRVRRSLPEQGLAGCHDCAPSFVNMAIASFRRLRPSRIRGRKNSVRRCSFNGAWADIELAHNLYGCCSPARASSGPAGRGGSLLLDSGRSRCAPTQSTITLVYSDSTAFANSSRLRLRLPPAKCFGV
jgi:hypothetical protein